MIYVLALLLVCSLLGVAYTKEKQLVAVKNENLQRGEKRKTTFWANAAFAVLLVILILFSGLRTVGNDTATYIKSFVNKVPDSLSALKEVDWSLGANPLFQIYQIFIKSCISDNPYVFVFITAILVCTSYLFYLKKYSENFGFSVFLLIAFTVYAFTMAAMKQTLAISIAIWTVPMFSKKRFLVPALLIVVAMLIHPYVFIFFAAIFLGKNIWDGRTWIILILTILVMLFFSYFMESALDFAAGLGDSEYDASWFSADTGVSIFRVAVYLVVPVMSWIYRKNLRAAGNTLQYTFLNMSIISSCFMILASVGGANMFGRMANYFDIINCFSIVIILKYGATNARDRNIITAVAVVGFCVFYFMYFRKYLVAFGGNWLYDYYRHTSFLRLFQ